MMLILCNHPPWNIIGGVFSKLDYIHKWRWHVPDSWYSSISIQHTREGESATACFFECIHFKGRISLILILGYEGCLYNEGIPIHLQHKQMTDFLRTKLHKKSVSKVYAFGKKQQILDNEIGDSFGTIYIEICETEKDKSGCLETMLITTIMSAAVELNVVGAKGEFMVITNTEEVSSILHYLTGRGHKIVTVADSKLSERLVSTRPNSFVWPKMLGKI